MPFLVAIEAVQPQATLQLSPKDLPAPLYAFLAFGLLNSANATRRLERYKLTSSLHAAAAPSTDVPTQSVGNESTLAEEKGPSEKHVRHEFVMCELFQGRAAMREAIQKAKGMKKPKTESASTTASIRGDFKDFLFFKMAMETWKVKLRVLERKVSAATSRGDEEAEAAAQVQATASSTVIELCRKSWKSTWQRCPRPRLSKGHQAMY